MISSGFWKFLQSRWPQEHPITWRLWDNIDIECEVLRIIILSGINFSDEDIYCFCAMVIDDIKGPTIGFIACLRQFLPNFVRLIFSMDHIGKSFFAGAWS